MTAWWEKWWAVLLAAVVATVPLWFVTLPPLIDLLGHMGRYHIQLGLAQSPALQANWAYHWSLIGNLGCDLLMELLGRLFGVEQGAVVLAGLILIIMISGIARLARAAHGSLPPSAWAAFPFAMSYVWHYGLVNYWLGIGCALHAAAFFYAPAEGQEHPRPDAATSFKLGVMSLLLWVVHIYGWAVFAILIWSRFTSLSSWRAHLASLPRLLPLGLPIIAIVALGYGRQGPAAETFGWFQWKYDFTSVIWTLRDQTRLFDIFCLMMAALLIVSGLHSSFRSDRALSRAGIILLIATLVIPFQLFGSAFANARLWPVDFIVALIALRPSATAPRRLAPAIAAGSAILFAARIGLSTIGFQAYDADYRRHLGALRFINPGAHVALFVALPGTTSWRRTRLEHLDGIAIERRDVFTNGQWEVPGAQLLVPLWARGTGFNADPSQYIRQSGAPPPELALRIAHFPRKYFELAWVIGYRPETLPRFPGLTPLFADDSTILYRIER